MKRVVCLTLAAIVAMLILVPSALAQDEDTMMPETNVIEVKSIEEIPATEPPPKLPSSGGPQNGGGPAVILLAATALLLGSGVLAYGFLRRRR